MKVFAAMYNPMTEESAYGILSLHLSKEGAERAVLEHQMEKMREHHRLLAEIMYESRVGQLSNIGEWDDFQDWTINEMEVLP